MKKRIIICCILSLFCMGMSIQTHAQKTTTNTNVVEETKAPASIPIIEIVQVSSVKGGESDIRIEDTQRNLFLENLNLKIKEMKSISQVLNLLLIEGYHLLDSNVAVFEDTKYTSFYLLKQTK